MARIGWVGAAAVATVSLVALVSAGTAWSADAPVASAPPPSSAPVGQDVIFNGNPHAQACEEASKFGDFNGTGIDECTLAISSVLLSDHDHAAAYVDRGAIHMQHKQYAPAQTDFEAAIKLDPTLANAYVDHGGALIALKHYTDGIAEIDRGLALGPEQPEKAYFNRGIADERLNDMKSAYADYLKASQLKPDWVAPKSELARFKLAQP